METSNGAGENQNKSQEGLLEEKDVNGRMITTVNAKAETHIESSAPHSI